MTNLDRDLALKHALQKATPDFDQQPQDNLLSDLSASFQGRYRILMLSAWIKLAGSIILMLFSVYQFSQQDSVQAMIAYAALAIVCCITMATIYLIFWVSINQQGLSRDMKRIELQLALLASKSSDNPQQKSDS